MLQQELTQKQTIDNLVALLSSKYFSEYQIMQQKQSPLGVYHGSRINAGPFCLQILSQRVYETRGVMTSFLNAIGKNDYDLGQVVLELVPPRDVCRGSQSPLVSISINKSDESNSGDGYDFSVYARLEGDSKLKSKWAEGVYRTLMELLPHKLKPLTLV